MFNCAFLCDNTEEIQMDITENHTETSGTIRSPTSPPAVKPKTLSTDPNDHLYSCINTKSRNGTTQGQEGPPKVAPKPKITPPPEPPPRPSADKMRKKVNAPAPPPAPQPLDPKEMKSEFEIGSMVEVTGINPPNCQYGVIRWFGYLDDKAKPIAGLEMVMLNFDCSF